MEAKVRLEELNLAEKNIVYQCMKIVSETDLIEDPEFRTRMSISRKELFEVIAVWPTLMDASNNSVVNLAINNSLNEVCNGIQISDILWKQHFTAPRQDVNDVCRKWFEQ
jgi:hypothetical protein